MRRSLVLCALLCAPVPVLAQAQVTTEMVPMRDGVRLATDVYLAADWAPGPVLLVRTTYGRDGISDLGQGLAQYGLFWVVAQEGSITRAAERLDVAVQTISGQLSLLERQIGKALFNAQGRGLVLSEAGRIALGYADQIFQLGDALIDAVQHSDSESTLRLRAGISDGIPKLLAYRLLSTVTSMPADVRLICDEGEFETLLADLALHRLDVVLTDRPAPVGGNLKVFSTRLGEFATGLFATKALVDLHRGEFPASLNGAPMLLPTRHHALRGRIDRWLEQTGIRPKIVGEFEDSAL
ncbi:MAG TPA: LysR family transcriptional regulator, partial [Myxococcota bacterium]|nr:LysR family transcriptional regulator [Myxococcota bacterium]